MPFQPRKPRRITNLDSRIFANLVRANRPLPVKQIAQRNNITWPTANQHVQKLARLNVLNIEKTVRKNRVIVNPKFMSNIQLKSMKQKKDGSWGWI